MQISMRDTVMVHHGDKPLQRVYKGDKLIWAHNAGMPAGASIDVDIDRLVVNPATDPSVDNPPGDGAASFFIRTNVVGLDATISTWIDTAAPVTKPVTGTEHEMVVPYRTDNTYTFAAVTVSDPATGWYKTFTVTAYNNVWGAFAVCQDGGKVTAVMKDLSQYGGMRVGFDPDLWGTPVASRGTYGPTTNYVEAIGWSYWWYGYSDPVDKQTSLMFNVHPVMPPAMPALTVTLDKVAHPPDVVLTGTSNDQWVNVAYTKAGAAFSKDVLVGPDGNWRHTAGAPDPGTVTVTDNRDLLLTGSGTPRTATATI